MVNVEKVRSEYPRGTLVELKHMEGEPLMKEGLRGTVEHVDDVGQIHVRWNNGSSLALNLDFDEFSVVDRKDTLDAVFVEPGRRARIINIDNDLKSFQEAVGGRIEEYMPFDDEAAIICNEDGKLEGLAPNRAVRDLEGEIADIICGSFLIVNAPLEKAEFSELSKEQKEKYVDMFRLPERFVRIDGMIESIKYDPDERAVPERGRVR